MRRAARDATWLVFAFVLGLGLLVAIGRPTIHDERGYLGMSVAAARALLGVPGTPFREAAGFMSPGLPLVLFPLAVALVACGVREPLPGGAFALAYVVPPLLLAVAAAATFALARRLGIPGRPARGAAVALATLTVALPYGRLLLGETMLLAAVPLAVLAARVTREAATASALPPLALGAAIGMLFLVKPVWVLLAPPLVVYAAAPAGVANGSRRIRDAALVALGVLPALLLYGALNLHRYGNPLDFGYFSIPDQGFETPLLVGLFGNLLSPGKGFFFYSPVLLLALAGLPAFRARHRAEARLVAVSCLLLVPVLSAWRPWAGGWCWGPRFLVPLAPLLALPLAAWLAVERPRWARRALLAPLIAVSLLVSALALAFEEGRYEKTVDADCFHRFPRAGSLDFGRRFAGVDDQVHLHFIPELSPLAGHAWMLLDALGIERPAPWARLDLCGRLGAELRPPQAPLAFWWSWLPAEKPALRTAVHASATVLLLVTAALGLALVRAPEETHEPARPL